jgi:hypothetical protein
VRWIAFAFGLCLVSLAWTGLVATFVLPRGRSLFQRLPTLVMRGVHLFFVRATYLRSEFSAKDRLLSAVGPVALLAQLATFLVALVFGFALMLTPWDPRFPLAFREAASGLFTVTLAHVAGPTNDVLVTLAAASGGVTIALLIGYLPVLYQSFSQREALVAVMEARAGTPAWGPEILMRHQLIASTDALPAFYEEWEGWSARVAESHCTHPVLLFFRSPEAGYSWLISLIAVLDAAAIQLALMPSTTPSSARMCLRMGFTALRRIGVTLGWEVNLDPSPNGPIDLSYEEFSEAVDAVIATGFVPERPTAEAWRHFVGWRVNYEAIAYRLADLLVAPPAPWSGERSNLRSGVLLPARPAHRSPDGTTRPDTNFPTTSR